MFSLDNDPRMWMITIYLFLASALLYFKPTIAFDGGRVREFGTGRKDATVFPLWWWMLMLAMFATPKETLLAASVMFSMSGVSKQGFMDAVKADPQTYKDWGGNGEWDYETTGKEDALFSPFLRKPFKRAVEEGLIPAHLTTIAGTWGTVTDQGDLTYLNLVHLPNIDGTDPADLTRGEIQGRQEAIYAMEALRKFMPGCAGAKLRNFGMTLGIRDTRKIDAAYNLTGDDVRNQARFDDAIGIFPEFIDGYGVLILPTTGRYWHVPYRAMLPKKIGNLLVAGRSIGGDKISHASARNMMCCAVGGQGAGVAAAVSIQRNESFDRLDIGAVQQELVRQGARIR
jgi:hypothetical protein